MIGRGRLGRMVLATTGAAVLAAVAGAPAIGATGAKTQLGSTTLPPAATMPASACTTSETTELLPAATDSSVDYTVPAGGGSITKWSFNTTGAKAGTPYALLVSRPSGASYTIIATDPETVPANAPTIATFKLAHPIAVQAGDVIGSVVEPSSRLGCEFKGGSIPSSDVLGFHLGPDTTGTAFTFTHTVASELVNVSATLKRGG
jgi:hypothetical protein